MFNIISLCIIYFTYGFSGARLLNITFLLVLFALASAAAVLLTVIFHLTGIYTSLQSDKLDFNIVVSNLISLPVLYIPLNSSFISTQYFVLNLGG